MAERILSLTIITKESDEEAYQAFGLLSDIAGELSMTHDSAWVSSTRCNPGEADEPQGDELFYDETTLLKVRAALVKAAAPFGHGGEGDLLIDGLINEMQNAGIFFRERR
jgi:hypothetical protein